MMLLSDGYLANGSEPWRIPEVADLPDLAVELATEPNGTRRQGQPGLPPLPARPRDARPAVGRPRHAGPGAPDRRHREGRRHRRHLLRPRQPRHDDRACARPRSTGSPRRSPTWRSTTRPATPTCWCSAGARPTARSRPPPGWSATPAATVARAHLRHLNPFPANTGDVLRAYKRVARAGDEPRPAVACCCARKYLVDVQSYNAGARAAVHRNRAGRRAPAGGRAGPPSASPKE